MTLIPVSSAVEAACRARRNTERVAAGRVYVTAFMDMKGFSKYASQIAFESDIWIAAIPDHMIHYNGDRFLGPYPPRK